MSDPPLLLHVCCAPCSTSVIELLKPHYQIATFFYNPNIQPLQEYRKRLREMLRYAQMIGMELITGEYEVQRWFESIKGLEKEKEGGARCRVCYRLRLKETARYAREHGFPHFATTLTVSPHKRAPVINPLAEELAGKYGLHYLSSDFKKQNGFKKSLALSNAFGLYRQRWCGCIFSQRPKSNNDGRDR